MILDATKRAEQRALLEAELESVGIRLNRDPPYVLLPCRYLGQTIELVIGISTSRPRRLAV